MMIIKNDPARRFYCPYCSDYKKYKSKNDTAEYILRKVKEVYRTSQVKYELDDADKRIIAKIHSRHNFHFMCGTCTKSDTQKLWRTEDEIKEYSYILYKMCYMNEVDDTIIRRILDISHNLLRGNYPNLSRLWDYKDGIVRF